LHVDLDSKALLAHGAKVYIAARNQASSEEAIRQLKQETGNEALFFKLDLADLRSIKASAEEFLR
jgi:retinol dehydrogenase-12